MCTFKFFLSLYVLRVEFDRNVIFIGQQESNDFKVFLVALIRTAFENTGVFFLCLWTFFTAFALGLFFFYISNTYIKDMTMNEEAKYEQQRDFFRKRLRNMKKKLVDEEKCDVDLMLRRVHEMESWFSHWKIRREKENKTANLIKLVIGN